MANYTNKFLDYTGLQQLWTSIKAYIGNKEVTNITITHSTDAAEVKLTKGDASTITASLNAASTSTAGLMSSADKTKLDGIEAGAQVNKLERIVVAAGDATTGTGLGTNGTDAILRIETDLSTVTADVNPLRPASALAVKNYVEGRLTSVNTELTDKINELTTTTATHTTQIAALQAADQILDKKIDDEVAALESSINTVSAAVKANADAIADHVADVNTKFGDYYTKTETDGKISGEISKLDSTVTASVSTSGLQVFTKIEQVDGKLSSVGTTNLRIVKAATANEGMASTYKLQAGDVVLGDVIDIAKDQVLKSGSVKIVATANTPYTGAEVGDSYIELLFHNQETPVYIPAKSLVTIYEDSDYLSTKVNTDGKPTISLDYAKLSEDILAAFQDDFVDEDELTEAISTAKTELIGTATSDYNTLGKVEGKVKAAQSAADSAIKTIAYNVSDNKVTTTVTTVGGASSTIDQHEIITIEEITALIV